MSANRLRVAVAPSSKHWETSLAEIREIVGRENLEIVGSFDKSCARPCVKGPTAIQRNAQSHRGWRSGWNYLRHPDRLARNAFDGGRNYRPQRDQGGDSCICDSAPSGLNSTAQGKLMLNLAFGQSKYYSDSLSTSTSGQRTTPESSRRSSWSWKALIGYLQRPEELDDRCSWIRKTAPLIQKVFELTRLRPIHDCLSWQRETMNVAGLRNGRNKFKDSFPQLSVFPQKSILRYGLFNLKWRRCTRGVHEPLYHQRTLRQSPRGDAAQKQAQHVASQVLRVPRFASLRRVWVRHHDGNSKRVQLSPLQRRAGEKGLLAGDACAGRND